MKNAEPKPDTPRDMQELFDRWWESKAAHLPRRATRGDFAESWGMAQVLSGAEMREAAAKECRQAEFAENLDGPAYENGWRDARRQIALSIERLPVEGARFELETAEILLLRHRLEDIADRSKPNG